MKHISSIVGNNVHELSSNKQSEDTTVNPKIGELIDQLFVFFYGICRGFEKLYHDPKRLNIEKTQWRAAFEDVGIYDRSQVEWGIKRTRLESPINTPTIKQFLDWCTPTTQQLGVPSISDAFDEACKNSHPSATKRWSHDVVHYAWTKTGSFELCNRPSASIRPIFEEHYNEAIKLHSQGKILRQIENNPPPPPKRRFDGKPMTREQAMAAMKNMIPLKRD